MMLGGLSASISDPVASIIIYMTHLIISITYNINDTTFPYLPANLTGIWGERNKMSQTFPHIDSSCSTWRIGIEEDRILKGRGKKTLRLLKLGLPPYRSHKGGNSTQHSTHLPASPKSFVIAKHHHPTSINTWGEYSATCPHIPVRGECLVGGCYGQPVSPHSGWLHTLFSSKTTDGEVMVMRAPTFMSVIPVGSREVSKWDISLSLPPSRMPALCQDHRVLH